MSAVEVSRQKRSIVIQNQIGGRTDIAEGLDDEDYDFKRPQPKHPVPDRLVVAGGGMQKNKDVEIFSPELLNKRPQLMDIFRRLMAKTKLGNYIY